LHLGQVELFHVTLRQVGRAELARIQVKLS